MCVDLSAFNTTAHVVAVVCLCVHLSVVNTTSHAVAVSSLLTRICHTKLRRDPAEPGIQTPYTLDTTNTNRRTRAEQRRPVQGFPLQGGAPYVWYSGPS